MRTFNRDATALRFTAPDIKIAVSGAVMLVISVVSAIFKTFISQIPTNYFINIETINTLTQNLSVISKTLLFIGIIVIAIAVIVHFFLSDAAKISVMIRQGLFAYKNGNPLHLKDGERLPSVKCKEIEKGKYSLSISATGVTVEDIQNIAPNISSCLNRKYQRYAVTIINADVAFNDVKFIIEDVLIDRTLTFTDVMQMKQKEVTKLIVQEGTYIDLTTSGSMLFAGKTRSGKTTGIISLLLQVLLCGRDNFDSTVTIIDPKQAELSQLPYVVTLDSDGEARGIINAIKQFADVVVKRQKILNGLSCDKGDAVHWWDAGFHVSLLFIDEYVACRSLFPKKAEKDSDYCLATFDALIKRLITMGASAGCYVIISIAQASVDEGGLPSLLRCAMYSKILYKPTLEEGRLLWSSDKLKTFPERVYQAGDAWFSSTDGKHDDVSYVHFPIMNFQVYRELGRLLTEYYENTPPATAERKQAVS